MTATVKVSLNDNEMELILGRVKSLIYEPTNEKVTMRLYSIDYLTQPSCNITSESNRVYENDNS